jgi:uncharacterized protein (DUF1778 family)
MIDTPSSERPEPPLQDLQDRCHFLLSDEAFDRFTQLLTAPQARNIALERVLAREPRWREAPGDHD